MSKEKSYIIFSKLKSVTITYRMDTDKEDDVRHWIINHLDLSLKWAYKEYNYNI